MSVSAAERAVSNSSVRLFRVCGRLRTRIATSWSRSRDSTGASVVTLVFGTFIRLSGVGSDRTLILSRAHARLGTEPNWWALDRSYGQTAHEIEEGQAKRQTLVGSRDPRERRTHP